MRGIYDAKDEDLIIISDNDEIPNLSKLRGIKIKKYAVFNQNSLNINLIYLALLNLLSRFSYNKEEVFKGKNYSSVAKIPIY